MSTFGSKCKRCPERTGHKLECCSTPLCHSCNNEMQVKYHPFVYCPWCKAEIFPFYVKCAKRDIHKISIKLKELQGKLSEASAIIEQFDSQRVYAQKKKRMNKLIIFDLDDTLVRYSNKGKKRCVPRQTFHCLRDLFLRGFILVCVTYNKFGVLIAHECGLFKYISFLQQGQSADNRSIVIAKVLQHHEDRNFIYFDDRMDNLKEVTQAYPDATCVNVLNPLWLHTLIKFYCL